MNKNVSLVFIKNKNSEILAVSRKDDETKMGLPGGKLEFDETFEEAAIRETFEETGLKIEIKDVIFTGIDSHGFLCRTFHANIIGDVPTEFDSLSEAGKVDWVSWEVLFSGPFSEYNKIIYNITNEEETSNS